MPALFNRSFVRVYVILIEASHYPVSLQQMVLFGQHPSQGTLLKASQFLVGKFLNVFD